MSPLTTRLVVVVVVVVVVAAAAVVVAAVWCIGFTFFHSALYDDNNDLLSSK